VRSESKKYATFRSLLLTGGAASALTLGLAPVAVAQDGAVEKVTVTGTRIKQRNLITTSPITQVTAVDIDTQGVTKVEDLTNQLPQIFASQGSNISNGASGTATLSLRGIGGARTLILINGRRMPYGSPGGDTSADLNGIPGQMVDRIEVLTGGASSIYGSDAVAGVVNFIMRRDFEGVQIDAQYGFFSHHNDYDGPGNLRAAIAARNLTNPAQFELPPEHVDDGFSKDITGVMGSNSADGMGNITLYAGYRQNEEVLQRWRDYSACSLGTGLQTLGGVPNTFVCGGSGTQNPARFYSPGFGYLTIGSDGFTRPICNNTDLYNFGPLNFYQRPDERYTLGAFGHYQVHEQVELYTELMFFDYRTVAQIAPSGNFFSTTTVNCGNPFLNGTMRTNPDGTHTGGFNVGSGAFSSAELTAMGCTGAPTTINLTGGTIGGNATVPFYAARRNVEGGGRQDDFHNISYRIVTGATGEIIPGWEYDLSLQYAQVTTSRIYRNEFSILRLGRAMNIVTQAGGDAALGTPDDVPVCQSFIDGTDPDCKPWNIFQLGGVTAESLRYLQVPLLRSGNTSLHQGIFTINGDLGTLGMKSPWADTPFAVVLGLESRRDFLEETTDVSFETGDGAGQGGPTKTFGKGAVDVTEYFGELEMFLLENQDFAKQVKVDLAYRYSEYDNSITADTWKIGADWAPTEDIRFRGSRQRAIRAANVFELFFPQTPGLFDMNDDPCDSTDPGGDGVAPVGNCVGFGLHQVTLTQYNTGGTLNSPAGQYNALFGGNLNLQPETADTATLGIVLTPSFVKGLFLSVDWFHLEIAGLISTDGAASTVNDCFFNGINCGRITRNPGGNQLWRGTGIVEDTNTNVDAGLEVTGIDVNGSYNFDLEMLEMGTGAGALQFDYIATYYLEWITDGVDCVGRLQCGNSVTPEYRHRLRATWMTPWDADLALTWRLRGEVEDLNRAVTHPDRLFETEHYFDIAARVNLPLNTALRVGVNNALDNDPPLSRFTGAGFGNGNTFPQNYDSMGRFVFMGLTVSM